MCKNLSCLSLTNKYQKAKVLSIAVPEKLHPGQCSMVGFRHVPTAIAHCRLLVCWFHLAKSHIVPLGIKGHGIDPPRGSVGCMGLS